jgi:hypothetical protein
VELVEVVGEKRTPEVKPQLVVSLKALVDSAAPGSGGLPLIDARKLMSRARPPQIDSLASGRQVVFWVVEAGDAREYACFLPHTGSASLAVRDSLPGIGHVRLH